MLQEKYFIDTQTVFEKCFKTDDEREKYMYMYSEGNKHYFKNIITRNYITVKKIIL